MKQTTNSLEEMQKIADEFISGILPGLNGAVVVGLYGNLGAGKTTMAQCIARTLGVNERVTSPTFVLEKVYELTDRKFTHLIHIDAYRIDKSEELLHLGWKEMISDPRNLVLVEWPERIADVMPGHRRININHISENSREIEVLE